MDKTITIIVTASWGELVITDSSKWLIVSPYKLSVRQDGEGASINTFEVDEKRLYIRQNTIHNRAITIQIQVVANSDALELRASHSEDGKIAIKVEGGRRTKQINAPDKSRHTIKL